MVEGEGRNRERKRGRKGERKRWGRIRERNSG